MNSAGPARRFAALEWIAIAAAIAARAGAIALAARSARPSIDPDGYLVLAAAARLTEPDGLMRPPLYPLMLRALSDAGVALPGLLLIQAALSGVTCAAILSTAREFAGRRATLAAGWVFALFPATVTAAPAFWSEALFVPLTSVALYLLVRGCRVPRTRSLAVAGVLFAAAALTRSIALYLVPILFVLVAVRVPGARRALFALAVVFIVTAGSYVAVVSARAGHLVLVDNSLEWHWRAREAPETARHARLLSVPGAIARAVAASPIGAAREAAARVRAVFSPGSWNGETSTQFPAAALRLAEGVGLVLLVAMVILAVGGMVVSRADPAALVLAAWVIGQLLLIALSATSAGPRYRAPIDPALLALAAAATSRLYLGVRASGIGGAGRLAQW